MVRYPAFIPLAAERRVLARVLGGWAAVAVGPGPPGGWAAAPCGSGLCRVGQCWPCSLPGPWWAARPIQEALPLPGPQARGRGESHLPQGPKVRRPLPRPPSAPRLEAWPRPPNPAVPGECGKGAEWPWAATCIYREGVKDPGVARPGLVAWEVARRAPSGQRRLGESGQAGALLQSQARGPRGSGQGAG